MNRLADIEPPFYDDGLAKIDDSFEIDNDGNVVSRNIYQDVVDDPERNFLSLFDN